MSDDDYRPIACGLHSELELLAMHRRPVRLVLEEGALAARDPARPHPPHRAG